MFKQTLLLALGLSLLAGCGAPATTPSLTLNNQNTQNTTLKTRATSPNTVVVPVSVMNSVYALLREKSKLASDVTFSLTATASRDGFKTNYLSATEVIDPENANLQGGFTFRLFNNRKLGKPSAGEYTYYILIESSSNTLAKQKKSIPAFSIGKGGTFKCQMK